MQASIMKPPKLTLGEFQVFLLSDGVWRNDGGCMFGIVPRVLWERDHPADERNRVRLGLTCPLVIRGREAILIDTGIGNRLAQDEREAFGHGEGRLFEGLRALGMEPGDITHVVLSHLHFDHSGGVVRRAVSNSLMPAFPKARYLVQRGEYETARSGANVRLRAAYRHVPECFDPLAGALELLDGCAEVISGVSAVVTAGHTKDHQVITVKTPDGEGFAHLADIVPTRSHLKPAWNQAYDLDPLRTMEAKAWLLEQAIAGRWWVTFAHDDQLLAARIGRMADGRLAMSERIAMAEGE
jgi:glyoxylase-like metal-dependent hydrolase (beta-lactamase superfamily II)